MTGSQQFTCYRMIWIGGAAVPMTIRADGFGMRSVGIVGAGFGVTVRTQRLARLGFEGLWMGLMTVRTDELRTMFAAFPLIDRGGMASGTHLLIRLNFNRLSGMSDWGFPMTGRAGYALMLKLPRARHKTGRVTFQTAAIHALPTPIVLETAV